MLVTTQSWIDRFFSKPDYDSINPIPLNSQVLGMRNPIFSCLNTNQF